MQKQQAVRMADAVRPGLARHPGAGTWMQWLSDDVARLQRRFDRLLPDGEAAPEEGGDTLPVPDAFVRMFVDYLLAMYERATSDYAAYENYMAAFNADWAEYRMYLVRLNQPPGIAYSTGI